MSGGLQIIASPQPISVLDRALWDFFGYPTGSSTAWLRSMERPTNEAALTLATDGTAATKSISKLNGRWGRLLRKHSNDNVWQLVAAIGTPAAQVGVMIDDDWALPAGVAASQRALQAIRFVECLRFGGVVNGSTRFAHGFTVGATDNLLTGGGPGGSGVYSGFGLMWRGTEFRLYTKAENAAPVYGPVLPNLGLDADYHVVEHRLLLPSVTTPGRYEFIVDGVKIAELLGGVLPTSATNQGPARPIFAYSDNGNAGTTPETHTLWSRYIGGPLSILNMSV